jgi:type II secretory pathway component PulF
MSPVPGDPGANPPRRNRPSPDPSRRPPPLPPEESTFRPNPAGAPAPGPPRPRKPKSDRPRDPLGAKPLVLAEGPKWWERILFGRVSTGQLAQFSRQFAAYLNAGVDISKSLSSLEKQFGGTALAPVIGRIQVAIKRGASLEEAMARETATFSPMYLSMIRVAEARGGVPETLKMLSQNLEARQRLVRQARSALIYPTIVLMLAGGVATLMSIFLLPMFASFLKEFSNSVSDLPWASRALMAFSRFVQFAGWWLMPLVLIGSPFLLIKLYRTPPGKALMDRAVLWLPVFGVLCRKLDTSRFARTMSVLLDAGLDFGSSIDLTASVVVMTPIRRAVRSAKDKVLGGRDLSTTLEATRQFSPDVIAVIQTGEETGKLPESLDHLADDYDEQIAVMVKNLGQLVQPMVTLLLGLVVLFLILAVFLPLIQMISNLSKPPGM